MSNSKEIDCKFEKLCETHFNFLEHDFGFRLSESIRNAQCVCLTYKNGTTGIQAILERDGVLIRLCRLWWGRIPSQSPFWEILSSEMGVRMPAHYLNTLLYVRAPEDFDRLRQLGHDVQQVIPFCARALVIHGRDILEGDFSVFKLLEKALKQRAKETKGRSWG